MPPRIGQPTVNQFAAQANTAHGLSNRVIFREGRLQTASGLSALFAGSQARRATVEAFRNSIVKEYGQNVANALSPRLDALCARGKSLKASVVQDILHEAQTTRENLLRINHATVGSFCQDAIPAYSLSAGVDAFCAAHPAVPAERRGDLRELVAAQLQTYTAQDGQNLLTPFQLFETVSRGKVPGMEHMLAACGEMPESSFYPYGRVMERAGDQAKDIAWLANFAGGNIFALSLMAEKLPEMRQLQPEGPISLDTAWQACFREEKPQDVSGRDIRLAGEAFQARADRLVADSLEKAGNFDPLTEMGVKFAVSSGIRMERAVELSAHPGRLSLEDLRSRPALYSLTPGLTLEQAEMAIVKDLHRWGKQDGLEGYDPVMTFRLPGGDREHHIQDISGLSDEQRRDHVSNRSTPISDALMDSVRELCGGNEAQQIVVGFGLSQAGLELIRNLSPLTGVRRDEHSPCDVTMSRDEAGNVTLHYETPPESPLDFRADYMVRPDGASELTAFEMGPRGPVQPQQAAPQD